MNSFSPEDGAFKSKTDMAPVEPKKKSTGLEIGPDFIPVRAGSSVGPSLYHRPLSRMRALARERTDLNKERLRAALIALFLLLALATQIFIEMQVR